jgi:predicted membrane metal-binding protein
MKIINFLFALISFASATLQLTYQNKLYNALGSHNKNRFVVNAGVPSSYFQVCIFQLEQATTDEQVSRALRSFHCKQAVKPTNNSATQPAYQARARRNNFRKQHFRNFHRQ